MLLLYIARSSVTGLLSHSLFASFHISVGVAVHILFHIHEVMLSAPLFHVLAAAIDQHVRLFKSADTLCHCPVPFGGFQPTANATCAKSVVTFGNSEGVHLLKVWRHVQIYPYLHAALLQVSAKVSLSVGLPNGVRHRCLVVYRAVRLHDCLTP